MKNIKEKVDTLINTVFTRSRTVTKTYHHNGMTIIETQKFKGSQMIYESSQTFYNNTYNGED